MKILVLASLTLFAFNAHAESFTLKCSPFNNDVSGRHFTVQVQGARLAFSFDTAPAAVSVAKTQVVKSTRTTYSNFTQSFKNPPYADYLIAGTTIFLPANMNASSVVVNYTDGFGGRSYPASCTVYNYKK